MFSAFLRLDMSGDKNQLLSREFFRAVAIACALSASIVGARLAVAAGDEVAGDETAPARAERARAEATKALAAGDFDRARRGFEQVLAILPRDAAAARDAARAAEAMGQFEYAEEGFTGTRQTGWVTYHVDF
jgi:tetratricopeptide (TPR) repeat protein